MKVAMRIDLKAKRFVFALDPDYFCWTPGLIEWGRSSPAEMFDAGQDEHWLYGWLGFTFFYARASL